MPLSPKFSTYGVFARTTRKGFSESSTASLRGWDRDTTLDSSCGLAKGIDFRAVPNLLAIIAHSKS